MRVDHFVTIGERHAHAGSRCEDFACSGQTAAGISFAAVADGCSGAPARTDIGARRLARAFERCVGELELTNRHWFDQLFFERLQAEFREQVHRGRFIDENYTTLVAVAATRQRAEVLFFGDGCVLTRYRDGRARLTWVEAQENAPYYLLYEVVPTLKRRYVERFGAGEVAVLKRTDLVPADGPLKYVETRARPLSLTEVERGVVVRMDAADIAGIVVASDGLQQIGWLEPAMAAVHLTPANGRRRRGLAHYAQAALKSFARSGQKPDDDLALGAVWMDTKMTVPGATDTRAAQAALR